VDHPALEESLDLASLRSIAQFRSLLAENIARASALMMSGVVVDPLGLGGVMVVPSARENIGT
jgi:hypothetical protein